MLKLSILPSIVLVLCFGRLDALYEDQIGKFDWKKEFVGPVEFSTFGKSTSQSEVVYVASDQNVVASLSVKTGEIVWRKVLEKGYRGQIQSFALVNNVVFVVTGTDVVQVRGWHAKNGYLTHQWSFLENLSESPARTIWHIHDTYLYKLTFTSDPALHFAKYRLHNGDLVVEKSVPVSANFGDNCAINNALLLCSSEAQLLSANLTAVEFSATELPAPNYFEGDDYSLKSAGIAESAAATFTLTGAKSKTLINLNSNSQVTKLKSIIPNNGDIYCGIVSSDSSKILISVNSISKNTFDVEGYLNDNPEAIFKKRYNLKFPIAGITVSSAECSKRPSGNVHCSILISTKDGSLILLKSTGKVDWVREEALSSIVTAEMIELPMSETEAEMQTEFDTTESDIVSMFTRRITSHIFQLQKSLFGLSGILEKPFSSESNKDEFFRDYFNLHKIILVITKQMKIYAIDNISRNILWSHLLDEEFEPFPAPSSNFEVRIPLFIQRSYRHYPHPMLCTILVRERTTKNTVLIGFNPIKGEFDNAVRLNYKVKQTLLLPKQTADDYVQGIALLDEDNNVHVYPQHTISVLKSMAHDLFFYVADAEACQIDGYGFSADIENTTLVRVWSVQCAGRIIKVAAKSAIEKVHSQGRVLPDRSVLYKYINPNLIAIVSQRINPEDEKSMLTLYLVDSVTGVIVYGDTRHRATDPVYLVHSENWLVLIYFSEKARRTEIVTFELYEGKMQQNSTAFSSVQAKSIRPMVDSRAYIMPTSYVEAARETITEKGITSKHVLVALSTGNIIELPWIFLDPRRPFANTPETKEEGVIPYMPEIPIPTESVINYNQTMNRVHGILTSPSGLESTSLTFVYGLDLFYTRVSPSKTFDLLKEDFDYMLIIIVLALLIILTVGTKHLSYRRALRQAWR